MITIKDFMETVDYRITEGSEYCWKCFGPYAYRLDSWNGQQDGHAIAIVFDTQTQEVYEVEAHDYKNTRSYRIQNPAYVEAHIAEAKSRNIDPNEAWEEDWGKPVKFIDLEADADWLDKARSIVQGLDYDTRVEIPLTLPDDALFHLMQLAHEQDITLNQLVENLLRNEIDRVKSSIELKPKNKKKSKKNDT